MKFINKILYWMFIGWWLEPIKYILKLIFSKKMLWSANVSTGYNQDEMEYVYKKAGGKNNLYVDSENIEVRHEFENKYDPQARAIYAYGVKIGYLFKGDRDIYIKLRQKSNPYLRVWCNHTPDSDHRYGAEFNVTYKTI